MTDIKREITKLVHSAHQKCSATLSQNDLQQFFLVFLDFLESRGGSSLTPSMTPEEREKVVEVMANCLFDKEFPAMKGDIGHPMLRQQADGCRVDCESLLTALEQSYRLVRKEKV